MFDPISSPFVFSLVFDLLRYLFILCGLFFLMKYYFRNQLKNKPEVANSDGRNAILPLRLQAYERFVLFLERIHPENLVMRLNDPDLSALQFQTLMIRTIREEFEHNLSQQLYIGNNLWDVIKNAREETVALINQASSGLPESAMSGDLVQQVFSISVTRGRLPVEIALDEIKKELKMNFF